MPDELLKELIGVHGMIAEDIAELELDAATIKGQIEALERDKERIEALIKKHGGFGEAATPTNDQTD